jgi:hypothetical protein
MIEEPWSSERGSLSSKCVVPMPAQGFTLGKSAMFHLSEQETNPFAYQRICAILCNKVRHLWLTRLFEVCLKGLAKADILLCEDVHNICAARLEFDYLSVCVLLCLRACSNCAKACQTNFILYRWTLSVSCLLYYLPC